MALEVAESVHDHHDYAKRHRDGGEQCQQQGAELASPPLPAKKGRLLRDPEGGIYISARSRARKGKSHGGRVPRAACRGLTCTASPRRAWSCL